MQIACPQCSTQYDLDERLLPPGGTPVECTKCRYVFQARPDGTAGPTFRATAIFGPAPGATAGTPVKKPVSKGSADVLAALNLGDTAAGRAAAAAATESAAEPPARSGTQVFGAASPAPAPQAPRSGTQVFGAVGGTPPAEPPRAGTQVSGAPAAQPPPAQPPRSGTQVFGAAPATGTPAAQPPRSGTQVFGAVGPGSGTPAQPPRSGTQVFGAPPAAEPPRASTQMFGAPAAPGAEPQQPQRSGTQVFGAVGSAGTPPQPSVSGTLVFGGAAPPPSEAAPRPATQVFGAPAPQPGAPAQRTGTAVFGAPPARTPTQGAGAPAGRTGTAVFGAAASPGRDAAGSPGADAPGAVGDPRRIVQTPGRPSQADAPAAPPADVSVGRTLPFGARPPPLELPPELAGLSQKERGTARPAAPAHAAPAASPRRWPLLLLLAAVLLAVAVGLALRARRGGAPAEAVNARQEAASLLRRDDEASRTRALASLGTLVAAHPGFVEAHADRVEGLALGFDDARFALERARGRVDALEQEMARLRNLQSPADWQSRVNTLGREVAKLREESGRLASRVRSLDAQLTEAQGALEAAAAREPETGAAASARALALAGAVRGDAQTPARVAALRTAKDAAGAALVEAEYLLAIRPRPDPESLASAARALEAWRRQDSSALRTYLLEARLALAHDRPEQAAASLDALLSLSPAHALARSLRDGLSAP